MKPNVSKRTVLVFKETLLPVSETFIEAQTRYLSNFVPRYIGLGRVDLSLALPTNSILLTSGDSGPSRLRQMLYRRVGLAPYFHRWAASAGASLIHAHFASGGRSALPLADSLGLPLVVTLHGSDVTTKIDFRRRYKNLWKKTSIFFCVSDFIRRRAAEVGFPTEKLRLHYIGIDQDVFRRNKELKQDNVVLFVGRLVEKKGCAFLLYAMARVKNKMPGVHTVIIGDGPLRASLERLGRQLGISCQFLGNQASAIVQKWISAARVFCAPSVTASNGDSEGLPIVIGEAQSMGVPVVSSYHAGIPEVVLHGRTGLLAPEGDSEMLAQHILRLLMDERFWEQCSQNGCERIQEQFNLRTQTRILETMYGEACKVSLSPAALRQRNGVREEQLTAPIVQ
jgi:colanic acid/amylovoran biosynthesis glycosyltransferase